MWLGVLTRERLCVVATKAPEALLECSDILIFNSECMKYGL